MKNYHIFEMKQSKDGFGIVADSSKLITEKKLRRDDALHTGTFEDCMENKVKFMNNPKIVEAIKEVKEKAAQKEINKLIKKHK